MIRKPAKKILLNVIKQEIVQFTKYVTRSYCPSDMKISMVISKKSLGRIKKHNPNRESAHSSHTAQWV